MFSLHIVHFIKPPRLSPSPPKPKPQTPKADNPKDQTKVPLTNLTKISNPTKRYHSGTTYHTSTDLTISTRKYLHAAFGTFGSRKRSKFEVETQENQVIDEETRDAALERIRDDLIRVMLEPPKRIDEGREENAQDMGRKKKSKRISLRSIIGPVLVGHCDVFAGEWRRS